MEATAEIRSAHLGFFDKLRVLAACVAAVIVMRTVGWRVAQPVDPDLAVTLADGGRSVLAIGLPLLALTAVVTTLGTAMIGRRLPEGGVFAAGIGLAALALHSGSMQSVLGYLASTETTGRKALMVSMAWDTLLWAAILAAAWVVAAVVRMWLWPELTRSPDPAVGPSTRGLAARLLLFTRLRAPDQAADARPAKAPAAKAGAGPSAASRAKPGWYALAVTGVLGAVIIWLTIARTPVASVARGQVIASVAGGLFLGAMAARYFTGSNDARWYALAALGVALTGYLLGYLNAGMGWAEGGDYQPYAALTTTPPHNLVRALPIEYIAVGVSAALAGFWSGEKIEHAAGEESR